MQWQRLTYLMAGLQGLYYVLTGLWSILSIETFQKVTGPKTDLWLVKTVGVLVLVSGTVLLMAAIRRRISWEIVTLAMGEALGLAIIDIFYTLQGKISPIYLADGMLEVGLVLFWFSWFVFTLLENRKGDEE